MHALVAVVCTAPLAWHLDRLPLGDEPVATVPRFNLWTLSWTADRLPHLLAGWWDAPIFWPVRGTFAFSEPQPLTGAGFAVLRPLTGGPVAYSLLLLIALTLNGVTADALARRLGARPAAAICAGVLAQALPFVFHELGVLQLVMVWPMFATLAALLAWCATPALRHAACVGLGLAAGVLTCGYYASLFALCLLVSAPLLVDRRWWSTGPDERARRVGGVMVGVATFGVVAVPLVAGQLERLADRHWQEATVVAGSAHWRDWYPSGDLWPGAVLLALAVAGVVLARRRHTTWFFVAFGGVALLASAGLRLEVAGLRPWSLLADHVGALARLRSPFRAAALVEVALVALAVPALDRLLADRRRVVRALAPVAVVVAVLTAGVGPGPLEPVPERPAWAAWLRDRPDGAAVVWLPFAPGTSVADFRPTVDAMLADLGTGHPLFNGYSGFFPTDHSERRRQLAGFPDQASVRALAHRDVTYVIADARWFDGGGRSAAAASLGLTVLERDPDAVLLALPSTPGGTSGRVDRGGGSAQE